MAHQPSLFKEKRNDTAIIALVDKRHLIRDCISAILAKNAPEIEVHGFSHVSKLNLFHISLVVLWIDQTSGSALSSLAEQVATVQRQYSNTHIAAFMEHDDPQIMRYAIEHGIALIKPQNVTREIMVASIRLALAGGRFAPVEFMLNAAAAPATPTENEYTIQLPNASNTDDFLDYIANDAIYYRITPREMELLQRLNKGLQNKVIAHELGIAESTVKVHLRNIMRKLNATNRTQVAILMKQFNDFR